SKSTNRSRPVSLMFGNQAVRNSCKHCGESMVESPSQKSSADNRQTTPAKQRRPSKLAPPLHALGTKSVGAGGEATALWRQDNLSAYKRQPSGLIKGVR